LGLLHVFLPVLDDVGMSMSPSLEFFRCDLSKKLVSRGSSTHFAESRSWWRKWGSERLEMRVDEWVRRV
jgi:hypothetical protein